MRPDAFAPDSSPPPTPPPAARATGVGWWRVLRRLGGVAALVASLLLTAAPRTSAPPPPPHAPVPADTTERGTTERDTIGRDTAGSNTLQSDTTRSDTTGAPATVRRVSARALRRAAAAGPLLLRRDSSRARHALLDPALPGGASLGNASLGDTARVAAEAGTRRRDTLRGGTLQGDTLRRVRRYQPSRGPGEGSALFPARPEAGRTARLLPPRPSFWQTAPGQRYEHRLTLDSTGQSLTAREQVGEEALGAPLRVDRPAYRRARHSEDLRTSWARLQRERQHRREERRAGLGVSIDVPGGRESAFTTIFGKNEVALDINGQADINAGFDYRRSDQQAQLTGSPTQIDPDFKQDLRLGITGSIGDKLQVDVNWDTQSQFDYQNQVKLHYTGYEDEIIQRVEAGNVFLDTPSRLIDGGQSLFGIKSQFQLGGLRLTTVASQQEGQSNSLTIEGGAETTDFDFSALRYDDRRHFFLGYYFRNTWEEAYSDPQALISVNGFDRVTDLEVWKIKTTEVADEQLQDVVAMVDLGEPERLLTETDGYDADDAGAFPRPSLDQYDEGFLSQLRTADQIDPLLAGRAEPPYDYQQGRFKLLQEERGDYVFDGDLGYLSLQQRLRPDEALAVAYRYRAGGQTYQVGDFANEGGGGRLVLKLLRPANLPAPADDEHAAWYLQLRNIYELRGRGFDENGFELDIQYNPPGGTAQTSLPELGGQRALLELLGLDRLDADGSARANGRFDFLPGRTINRDEGLLIFPYLQPFGTRLREAITEEAPPEQQAGLLETYVFDQLYTDKPERLDSENTETDRYQITGSSQGSAQEFYDLRAFNGVVEGSVNVTASGTPLTEGTDYQVDYQSGAVTIINDSYLGAGSEIQIDYEKNALVNLQKKTLLGARADYRFSEDLSVGATLMRLSQRSPADKLRLGQEPIKNTIWGVDAALELDPRWLTRAVDALPLLETRAPSALTVNAEFAQLRPSHTETQAFERTRRRLQDNGRDFADDELGGISYIDDFEGFENSFSLKSQLRSWRLAAPPANYTPPPNAGGGGGNAPEDSLVGRSSVIGQALAANNQRGALAWYQLNNNIVDALEGVPSYNPQLKQLVNVRDVFPNRDTRAQVDNTLRTLDLYFDPQRRGPYNYTGDLAGFLDHPEAAWGGMTQDLPEGQTDFGVQNIEFVEFVFRPYPEGEAAADSAALYLDLGRVSEDVIPNGEANDEDGLSLERFNNLYPLGRSREPISNKANGAVDIEGNVTEDLGLDGLASYVNDGTYGVGTEAQQFTGFLDALPAGGSARLQAEVARARRDPSADDYQFYENDAFFEDPTFFPGGAASFQERFLFYYPGLELNSYQAQNTLSSEYTSGRGNARTPDAENFAFDQLNQRGSYFQYRIPLNEAALQQQAQPDTPDDFIVGEIKNESGEGTGWYQARIPVRSQTRTVGDPDLSFVEHMRLWTTGHRAPMTLRFATLELVGSQWRQSTRISVNDSTNDATPDDSKLTIASVNNEEDSGVYEPPARAVVGQQQLATGGRQNTREQSLVVRVEDLQKGQKRAVFKNVQNLNLLKYNGLRMFAHLHSSAQNFSGSPEETRGEVELFVRLGANETNDYYEYRQPLTPTLGDLSGASSERLWYPLDAASGGALANEMNLRLTALNQLKVARDRSGSASLTEIFWSDAPGVVLDPEVESFAPSGAKVGIKGTPSLQDVSTIVIGVRVSENASRDDYEDLTLWTNELRATGYDEQSGWKAFASADIQLADFADVQANFQRQTDGWGALSSTLGERQQNRLLNWNLNTVLYADKLLPASSGWQIPVTLQLGSQTSTPRFAPNRGDVRLDAILAQAEGAGGPVETGPEEVLRDAQTHTADQRVRVSVQKSGSESPWLRYTLDQLSLVYNLSQTEARNPSLQINDNWKWGADLDYRYSFEKPHTVRPLWFLEELPLIGGLGALRFNYAPQSVAFFSNLARNASQRQDRNTRLLSGLGTGGLREPVRDQHSFEHERRFEFQYHPFEFMRLSFDTRTTQSLNRLGAREEIRVVGPGGEVFLEDGAGRPFGSDTSAASFGEDRFGVDNFFVERRLDVNDVGASLEQLFSGERPRTNRYYQNFTASFDLPFGDSEALNWIDFDDVSYRVGYGWDNGPRGRRELGASASNDVTISSGLTLHPREVWSRLGFWRRLEEEQAEADRAAEAERREEEREGEQPPAPPGAAPPGAVPPGAEADSTGNAGDSEGGGQDAEAGSERSWSDLPLPNPLNLLRRTLLAVTGVRDFTVQYDATRKSRSSHVGFTDEEGEVQSGYTLIDALQGEGPPLGYRFGLGRRIGSGLRLTDASSSLEDHLRDGNELRARTTLQFSSALQVDLSWTMNWEATTTYSNLRPGESPTRTLRGSGASSVWAFGGGYRAFFERQLETLRGDEAAGFGESAAEDGRVALTNDAMGDDFQNAFASSLGAVGESGFLALPLPNWRVTYSGLSDWPLLRSLAQSVRLTHGYTAEYASDYRSATTDGGTSLLQLGGGREVPYARPAFDSQRQSVQERYQPLIGMDVSWNGALSTNIRWNRAHAFSLRPASDEVVEDRADELSFTADFRKRGLDIPFLPFGELENEITFSLTASRTVDRERDFLVRDALVDALGEIEGGGDYDSARALEGENVSVRSSSTRLQVAPKISYRFSNRISADFALRYEHFEGNRRPSYSNVDGGFNVRVRLQE